ncbi:hypothetical protein, partial [Streptomyces sp. NPDC057496]|uniref:hypothetical protein n=1 Tax=Streptomyces sp. NPDC057496 TaxID=3346149 RepID=UPI003682CD21
MRAVPEKDPAPSRTDVSRTEVSRTQAPAPERLPADRPPGNRPAPADARRLQRLQTAAGNRAVSRLVAQRYT